MLFIEQFDRILILYFQSTFRVPVILIYEELPYISVLVFAFESRQAQYLKSIHKTGGS